MSIFRRQKTSAISGTPTHYDDATYLLESQSFDDDSQQEEESQQPKPPLSLPQKICRLINACCLTTSICSTLVAITAFFIATVAIGIYAYHKALFVKKGYCFGAHSNTPANFQLNTGCDKWDNIPSSVWQKYWVPSEAYQEISIPMMDFEKDLDRPNDGQLSAYFYNASLSPVGWNGRSVVTVHGIRGCKNHYAPLLSSSMLWNSGFHVLSIDLRNHGQSSRCRHGFVTFGSGEHFDVWSGVGWLTRMLNQTIGDEQQNIAKSIGIQGISMGAATVMVAWARDPSIPCVWADSPPCLVEKTLKWNAEGALGKVSGGFITWMMCQGGALWWKDYSCFPWIYDPFGSIRNNLMDGAVTNRSIHFEQTHFDIVVPEFNSHTCHEEIQKQPQVFNELTILSVNGSEPENKHTGGKVVPCDFHIKNMLQNPMDYQRRMSGFFMTKLSSLQS